NRCHRQNMKTSIINGSEVSRLSVAIHSALGMLMSLSSNIESLTGTTTRLVESVNATSYPSVR
ncbi:hypothetical protein M8U53_23165, partial [Enterobacter hormaechei]|uniref:hypothetical protein n=1 Tax=Enterobacter hormaechei TaxID=158836 RepID=UPI002076655C